MITDGEPNAAIGDKKFLLAPLTVDHYFALIFCARLKKGLGKSINPERIKDYAIYFFENHFLNHLEDEAKLVLSYVDEGIDVRVKTERQHQKLKKLYKKLKYKKNTIKYLELIIVELQRYVRYEERSLFPFVQNKLTNAKLPRLRKNLKEKHMRINDNWIDAFWDNC